eukprot:TRINITY_DN19377_c0_g1_i1.p1 TRINITY_DN19377_c0_g1~~TRINITY_DN19377_c0_g1_i1.p1  ORF type:complete len:377 (+),score=62.70 TRINITY_DN19377_c0_g1_i1:152-1282(+)
MDWNSYLDCPLDSIQASRSPRVPHPPVVPGMRPSSAPGIRPNSLYQHSYRENVISSSTRPSTAMDYRESGKRQSKSKAAKDEQMRITSLLRSTECSLSLGFERALTSPLREVAYNRHADRIIFRQNTKKAWGTDLTKQMKVWEQGTKYFRMKTESRNLDVKEKRMLKIRTRGNEAARCIQIAWRQRNSKKDLLRRKFLKEAGVLKIQSSEREERSQHAAEEESQREELRAKSVYKKNLTMTDVRRIVQESREALCRLTNEVFDRDQIIEWGLETTTSHIKIPLCVASSKQPSSQVPKIPPQQPQLQQQQHQQQYQPPSRLFTASKPSPPVTHPIVTEELNKLHKFRAEVQQREKQAADRVAELEMLLTEAEQLEDV